MFAQNPYKNMKRILFSLLLPLALSLTAKAQTYSFLTFTETDGTETSVPAAGAVITFDGGILNAQIKGYAAYSFFMDDLVSMRFTETATGIAKQQAAAFASGNVQVYDTTGRLLRSYIGDPAEALQGLKAAGIYVVKANGRTQKRTVR